MADILKHLDLNSADGTQLNLDALYQIAPSAFTEVRDDKTGVISRKVNFEVLRQLLGDHATDGDGEMYQFTWVGKNAARAEAAKPTDKTLRPVVEDSVDWVNNISIPIQLPVVPRVGEKIYLSDKQINNLISLLEEEYYHNPQTEEWKESIRRFTNIEEVAYNAANGTIHIELSTI